MKKRPMINLTALILSLVLVLGACTSPAAVSSAPTDTTAASATVAPSGTPAAQEESNLNETGFPIVKKPITLNVMACAYGNVTLAYNDMTYFKELEQLTNVHIEWNAIKSGDEFGQKKNLMYASGVYPDMILKGTNNANDEEKYGVEQKILIPLDSYMEKYMPNYTKILSGRPDFKKIMTATDGHVYGIGVAMEMGYESPGHFFINKKWLDKLNLGVPKSLDELESVLEAFKSSDPNGNGESDEIPYSTVLFDSVAGINNFISLYGIADPNSGNNTTTHLNIIDGKIVFTADKPQFKDAIVELNKLYSQGLIDQEFITQDGTNLTSKIQSGNVGFFAYWRLTQSGFYEGIENDYVCVEPFAVKDGVKPVWLRQLDGLTTGQVVLTKENKYVEASLRWIDAQMDFDMGMKSKYGVEYTKKNDQGKYEQYLFKADGTAASNDDVGQVCPGPGGIYFFTSDMLKANYVFPKHHAEKYPYQDLYRPYLQSDYFNVLNYLRLSTEDRDLVSRIGTDIESMVKENVINMITKGNVDATWDQYIENLKSLELDKYVQVFQAALDRYNSN